MAAQKLVLSDMLAGEYGSKRYVYTLPSGNRVGHIQILLTPAEFSRRGHPGSLWVDLDVAKPEEGAEGGG